MAAAAAASRRRPDLRRLISTAAEAAPLPTVRAVKSFIRSSSDADAIADAFARASPCPAFRRDRSTFSLAAGKLAAAGRPDLLEQVLGLQTSFPTPSEGFWVRLISLYAKHRLPHLAARTFAAMAGAALGSPRTDKSLSALLAAHLRCNQLDELHRAFAAAEAEAGIVPGVASHNVVLAAHCEAKNLDAARSLLSEMEKGKTVKPDIVSYNTILGAYFRDEDDAMFTEVLQKIAEQRLEENLVTFNYRLLQLCRKGESLEGKKVLLEEMGAKGVEPSVVSYNAVISGLCKEGKVEAAKAVFEGLAASKSARPNSVTYHTLVSQLSAAGEVAAAAEMCRESLRKKWMPAFSVMEGLVKGLVEKGMVETAREVVEMGKGKLRPGAKDAYARVEKLLPSS